MSTEAGRRRFPWGLTIVCALSFVLLIGLGVWQVQRLQWKQGLIADAGAAATSSPIPLVPPKAPSHSESSSRSAAATPAAALPTWTVPPTPQPLPVFPEFQRVIISCHWQARGYVELRSIHDGVPGVRIISLCSHGEQSELTGSRRVPFLVDRGFIADGVAQRPAVKLYVRPPTGPGTPIVAQARTTPPPGPFALPPQGRIFYARDNRAIVKALGGDPDYFGKQVLFAEESTAPEVAEMIVGPPPAAFSNNHLGYALTWFGLALAVIAFYIVLLKRRLRGASPATDTEKSSS